MILKWGTWFCWAVHLELTLSLFKRRVDLSTGPKWRRVLPSKHKWVQLLSAKYYGELKFMSELIPRVIQLLKILEANYLLSVKLFIIFVCPECIFCAHNPWASANCYTVNMCMLNAIFRDGGTKSPKMKCPENNKNNQKCGNI